MPGGFALVRWRDRQAQNVALLPRPLALLGVGGLKVCLRVCAIVRGRVKKTKRFRLFLLSYGGRIVRRKGRLFPFLLRFWKNMPGGMSVKGERPPIKSRAEWSTLKTSNLAPVKEN